MVKITRASPATSPTAPSLTMAMMTEPNFDLLFKEYPPTTFGADDINVGVPVQDAPQQPPWMQFLAKELSLEKSREVTRCALEHRHAGIVDSPNFGPNGAAGHLQTVLEKPTIPFATKNPKDTDVILTLGIVFDENVLAIIRSNADITALYGVLFFYCHWESATAIYRPFQRTEAIYGNLVRKPGRHGNLVLAVHPFARWKFEQRGLNIAESALQTCIDFGTLASSTDHSIQLQQALTAMMIILHLAKHSSCATNEHKNLRAFTSMPGANGEPAIISTNLARRDKWADNVLHLLEKAYPGIFKSVDLAPVRAYPEPSPTALFTESGELTIIPTTGLVFDTFKTAKDALSSVEDGLIPSQRRQEVST
jgi:hypothetical protein